MPYILDKDGLFETRPSQQGEDSGNGVFCVDSVKAGTMLPYTAIAFKEKGSPEDLDRTYVIAADFYNTRGSSRTSKTYSLDGNPFVEPVKSMEEYHKLACQINEASRGSKVNCVFCMNPFLDKDSFKTSSENQEPLIGTYVVITEYMEAGTELLTSYGEDYGKRPYKVCKMKKREYDTMIDRAYEFVDVIAEDHTEKKKSKNVPSETQEPPENNELC